MLPSTSLPPSDTVTALSSAALPLPAFATGASFTAATLIAVLPVAVELPLLTL